MSIETAKKLLKRVFGYDDFISLQEKIISSVLQKKSTLAVMPTGGGKSVCYQVPALVFPGLTIVISPLISLMKDQVEQLHALGVPAVLLNSSLTQEEYSHNVQQVKTGNVKLLYLAPEALMKTPMLDMLSGIPVDCIAIDEAHCISAWGHDFRPEYRQLADARMRFPNAVCIALTATATPRVREDIRGILGFDPSAEFVASFDRPNLFIKIDPKTDALSQTVNFIRKFPNQSGIIYCATRKQVDDLAASLSERNVSARPYHAGMPEEQRSENQELFARDDIQIIVATVAFGMGINKSNIRFIVHFDLPQNIENYYQEIGRAGRDGIRSECLLLFSYGDIHKIKFFIKNKTEHEKRVANIHLNALLQFAEAETCRRIPLLNYFGEKHDTPNCGMCDNCLKKDRRKQDLTIPAQKFLSCVKRTGEKFGAAHIIDVLRGSKAQKVLKFNHDRLSTYDIGNEYSKRQWLQMSRQFLHQGLMVQDMEFGGLMLTAKAWEVFRGTLTVEGFVDESLRAEPEKKPDIHGEYDEHLFELLRIQRKELADQAGVPPYVVFSDRTLAEMSTYFPQSETSLLHIHGVGETKLQKYGLIFLDIIRDYCGKNQIDEHFSQPAAPETRHNETGHKKEKSLKRHTIIGEAFNSGKSVKTLMAEFGVKQQTIISHLYQYTRDGNLLRPEELKTLSAIDETRQNMVMSAFREHGTEYLSPVFETLGREIPYDELHILRLCYLNSQKR